MESWEANQFCHKGAAERDEKRVARAGLGILVLASPLVALIFRKLVLSWSLRTATSSCPHLGGSDKTVAVSEASGREPS